MKLIDENKYLSIFAAIEYKNKFDSVMQVLNNNKLNTEFGFKQNILEFLPSGVRSLKINSSNIFEGQIFITLNKISYEAVDLKKDEIDNVAIVLNEARKILENEFKDSLELKFVGCVLRNGYSFDGDEATFDKIIKEHFSGESFEKKKIEIKLNFNDDDKLNYNIQFNIDIKKKVLFVSFDINTIYVENRNKFSLEDIIKKVKSYMDDMEKLKELLFEDKK